MQTIIQAWKGIVFIVALFVVNAVLWLTATPLFDQPFDSIVAQIMGANLLLMFTIVFFLATKNRILTKWFNGLENLYFTHRILAMVAVLGIFLHAQTASLIFAVYSRDVPFDAISAGPLARNLFIGLVVVALLAKYLKYEQWRTIHRLMVIPYIIAFYHAFALSSFELVAFSPLSLWMIAMFAVGVGSSVYMILLYRRTAFKYDGEVIAVRKPAESVIEFEVKTSKPFHFKNGQFAFIKTMQGKLKGEPHPFSISGSTKDSVMFTIKALGDYTKGLQSTIQVGDHVALTEPFGHMTFDDYDSPQVWVAGGIGITPFLSHVRSVTSPKQKVTLYYTARNKADAVHLDQFENLAKTQKNFNFIFSESDKDGFLNVQDFDLDDNPTVFMCGPLPMAKALKKAFKKEERHKALICEAFSFTGTLVEDVVQWTKQSMRKLKRSS